ncbi:hypothetical protein THAOC_06447, partial [Thalassiosira oceanica]
IGAGWAGIAAVQELHEKGISNVLVLEAEDYIGGRSKSFNLGDGSINRSPFELSDDNIPLDIGSEWLYDSGDILDFLWDETELLSRVDLDDETDYWLPLSHSQFYRQTPDGTTKRMSDGKQNELYYTIWTEFDDFRYDLGYSYSLQDAYDQFVITKIEDERDEQYLNLVLDALSIECGAEIDHFRKDKGMIFFHSDNMYYMSRQGAGFGNTARAVAEPFIDKIEMNSKLTSIDYRNPNRVVAEFDKNGKTYAVQARSAIVTVSLGVLQANTISFNPKLPRRKLEAMAGLGFGLVNKCIMVWEKGTSIPDEKWFNLLTPEDETSGIWTTFSSFTEYKSLPTIVGWIGGDEARNMEEMADDEIMREVWNHLSSIYPTIPQPKYVYISRWGQEENFRGSYSHGKWRSSHSTASRILGERIGNVHFAGEATAYPWYATTRGAWDSGKRAANEIHRRQDGEGFCGVEPKLLEEMFTWGGCRVRMAKEMSGLVALPVGACCGDDIEGGGVRGGAQVGEVGLRSVLERGQGLAGPSAKKEVAEDRAEVAVGTDGDGQE